MVDTKAEFIERKQCPGCGSGQLAEVASGRFADSPLRELIENDPWGESPMPYLMESGWRFMRCAECSLAFHQKILSPEWNEIRLSRWMTQAAIEEFEAVRRNPDYDFDAARTRVEHVLRLEKLTRDLRGDDRARVLDFGCGRGEFLATCELFGFVAVGVDASAARDQGSSGSTIYREIADLGNAPEAAEGFHAVALFETIEHLARPLDTLNELSRYLLPGGILVLEAPDCRGVAGIETEQDYRLIHPMDNINAFDPQSLRGIARRAGFAPIERPVVQVTSEPSKVLKREIKRVVSPLMRPTTQLYLRKFR